MDAPANPPEPPVPPSGRDRQHSVCEEPHLRMVPRPQVELGDTPVLSYFPPGAPDAADRGAESVYDEPALGARRPGQREAPAESVWHEPSRPVGAAQPLELPYARYLTEGLARTTGVVQALTVLMVALLAGPWAVVGTLWTMGGSVYQLVALVVVGPLVEEVMKVAALAVVVERWPYLLKSPGAVLVCAMAGGLSFAAIENVLYLFVYFPDASASLWLWRWTVCVGLHVGCSAMAGMGLVRVLRKTLATRQPPDLYAASPMLVAATVVHGAYNGAVYLTELLGVLVL